MFGVIDKADYFGALSADKLSADSLTKLNPYGANSLKHVQDAWILANIRQHTGSRILEVGGADSRVLKVLDPSNEKWNLDEFKGVGHGPKTVFHIEGVKNLRSKLGDFSPGLPADHFDVVFSVSVVEHVPSGAPLQNFFADAMRVLKPGGVTLHAIDLYLTDKGAYPNADRLRQYLAIAESTGLKWIEPPAIDEDVRFSCAYATHPDIGMYRRNAIEPSLKQVRSIAQSVSLKLGLRKP